MPLEDLRHFEDQEIPQNDHERMIARDRWLLTDEKKIQDLLQKGSGFAPGDMFVVTKLEDPRTNTESIYAKFFSDPDALPPESSKIIAEDIEGTLKSVDVYAIQALPKETRERLAKIGEEIKNSYRAMSRRFAQKAQIIAENRKNGLELTENDLRLEKDYMELAIMLKNKTHLWGETYMENLGTEKTPLYKPRDAEWIPTILQKMRIENGKWVVDETYKAEFSLPPEVIAKIQEEELQKYKVHKSDPPALQRPENFGIADTHLAANIEDTALLDTDTALAA